MLRHFQAGRHKIHKGRYSKSSSSRLDLGRSTIIERRVRQLGKSTVVGIPESLVGRLPPLNCSKLVAADMESFLRRADFLYPNGAKTPIPCNVVTTKSGQIIVNTEDDLRIARE